MSGPVLTVSTSAITNNATRLRGDGDLIAVVKADGFGVGATTVAAAARQAGAALLGVATLAEAAALCATDAASDVGVLAWLSDPDDLSAALPTAIELAIGSREHLTALLTGPRGAAPRRVHLFVDTGMSRDGCPAIEWPALCKAARSAEQSGAIEVVGVMGHLGCAEPEQLDHTLATGRFRTALAFAHRFGLRPELVHLAATSAALGSPGTRHNAVRVGAGLVGIDPSGLGRLQPVATLSAPVVQVRHALAGSLVGYGTGTRLSEPTWLGLLPLGYADGLPRAASGRAEVLIAGRRRKLLGPISMDQVVVDLGDTPVSVGTEATVFGVTDRAPRLADWAAWADTIEHEVLTRIGPRVRRRVVATLNASSQPEEEAA
ncbi:alanine racemase [Nocardioides sp. Bht2]|uniref:alanine racemase n=1 Tax=Nocardioides sp. Bht2 TaxID=3392297 RepID=UPI0039B430AB